MSARRRDRRASRGCRGSGPTKSIRKPPHCGAQTAQTLIPGKGGEEIDVGVRDQKSGHHVPWCDRLRSVPRRDARSFIDIKRLLRPGPALADDNRIFREPLLLPRPRF